VGLNDVRTFALDDSSLAELRELVAETRDWPAATEVRVKGRIEFDLRGQRVAEIRLTADRRSTATVVEGETDVRQ
jgi:hypothetical protein